MKGGHILHRILTQATVYFPHISLYIATAISQNLLDAQVTNLQRNILLLIESTVDFSLFSEHRLEKNNFTIHSPSLADVAEMGVF